MASWLTTRNSNLAAFNAFSINYSTLTGSTSNNIITAGRVNYSTITGSSVAATSVATNSLLLASTLTGSSIVLSGNVGIGSNAPAYTLDLGSNMIGCGAVNTPSITTKGTGNLTVATQSTGLLILNSQGGALALQSGGTTLATISSLRSNLLFGQATAGPSFTGWDNSKLLSLVPSGTSNGGGGLGIGYNDTTGGQLVCVETGVAHKTMNYWAISHKFYDGVALSTTIDSTGQTFANGKLLLFDNATGGQCIIKGDGVGNLYHQVDTTASAIYFSTKLGGTMFGNFSSTGLTVGTNVVLNGGQYHLFCGYNVFGSTAVGAYNIIIGATVGRSGSTGTYNTLCGHGNGYSLTNGGYNTMFGNNLGYSMTSGGANTLVGYQNGTNITTGNYNTLYGHAVANDLTTGTGNTFIGYNLGGINIGNYNVLVGASIAPSSVTSNSNCIYIGNGIVASVNVSYEMIFGPATGRGATSTSFYTSSVWFSGYGAGTLITSASGQITASSDKNIKNNIVYLSKEGATNKILQLKPATYQLNNDELPHTYTGFIAQDVMEVLPTAVDGKKIRFQFEKDATGKPKVDEDGNIVYLKNPDGSLIPRYLSLQYNDITSHLVLAVQEQHAVNQEQQSEINDLKIQLVSKSTQIDSQQIEITSLQTQLSQVLQRLAAANIA